MASSFTVTALVGALAIGVAGCAHDEPSARGAATTADTLYHGGPIVTLDDTRPHAEAVAVRDGRILAVGSAAELEALRGARTRDVDLAGRTLVPGFFDGHAHFYQFGLQAVGASLLAPPDGGVETIDDLVETLQRFAEGPDVAHTGWIFGLGYDDAVLAEGRHPTRDDLDRVSTEVPVIAVHISGHFSVLNSAGLELVGYDADSADPPGGVIRRRPGSNEPNGVLEELASIPVALAALTPKTPESAAYFLRRAQEQAARFGYTTVQEGRAFAAIHAALAGFAESEGFDLDVVSYIDFTDRELLESAWAGDTYRGRYRIAGMKITLDGSPQGRTAWRTTPYLVPPDGQPDGYAGYPALADDAEVAALFEEAYTEGWQVLVHANGDAAIDQLLRAVRPAHRAHGPGDRRHTLIHGQFIRQDQLDALVELQIVPSLFPMHTFYWGDWYDTIIGPEAAQRISPMRSAVDRGLRPTSHTDAPVALPNLIRVMAATVNRTSRSGKVMGPSERLTPLEALKSVTLWSARQHFEEHDKGSIEVGKLADFVLLSANPLTVAPDTIESIEVLATVKEDVRIYTAR